MTIHSSIQIVHTTISRMMTTFICYIFLSYNRKAGFEKELVQSFEHMITHDKEAQGAIVKHVLGALAELVHSFEPPKYSEPLARIISGIKSKFVDNWRVKRYANSYDLATSPGYQPIATGQKVGVSCATAANEKNSSAAVPRNRNGDFNCIDVRIK